MGQGNALVLIGVLGCITLIVSTILLSILLIISRRKNLAADQLSRFGDLLDRIRTMIQNFTRQKNESDLRPVDVAIPAENLALLKRVSVLEEEIITIKSSLQRSPLTLWGRVQRTFSYLSNYWGFLSFLGSIILLIYIQLAFGVDYFEGFRDISTEKKLSEFYRKEGDDLLKVLEFPAAATAYQKALEIDPHNELASFGLAKSQVFDLEEGQKYLDIQLAERKLDYLLKEFDGDYHLYLMKALIYDMRGDPRSAQEWADQAKKKVEEAIATRQGIGLILLSKIDTAIDKDRKDELVLLNENLASCHVMLGFIKQKHDLAASQEHYEDAVSVAPTNVPANNNLGYIYLLKGEYEKAKKHLETANYWSPRWVTWVNLGDLALYSKDLRTAETYYAYALKVLEEPDIKPTESFVGGKVVFNFMPLEHGDTETIKNSIDFATIESKKLMIYYNLSFVYALDGNFAKADALFRTASKLDSPPVYNVFFASKLISIRNLISPDADATSWIDEHIESLDQAD